MENNPTSPPVAPTPTSLAVTPQVFTVNPGLTPGVPMVVKAHHMPLILKIFLIFIGLIVVLGVLAVGTLFLFPQVYATILIHWQFPKTKFPLAYAIPVDHQISSPPSDISNYPEFSFGGLSFRVPWRSAVKGQKNNATVDGIYFNDGSTVFITLSQLSLASSMMEGKSPAEVSQLKQIFGEDTFKSNYNLQKATLSTSPDAISFKSSPKQAVAEGVLVALKAVGTLTPTSPDNNPKILNFTTSQVRGFEITDQDDPTIVNLNVFDNQDKESDFRVQSKNLTQSQIDFIIASMTNQASVSASASPSALPSSPTTSLSSKTVVAPKATTTSKPAPTSTPVASTSKFHSLGSQPTGDGVSVDLLSATDTGDNISVSIKFTNTSTSSQNEAPIRVSMRNSTQGVGPTPAFLPTPLGAGQSQTFNQSYPKSIAGPYSFYYASTSDGANVLLGTYTP